MVNIKRIKHDGTWLNKAYAGIGELSQITYDIERLANAFAVTGNSVAYDKLSFINQGIDEAVSLIRDAVTQSINEGLREAQRGSVNVLRAALSGINVCKNGGIT